MRDWKALSEQLEEWREHPATVALREAMDKVTSRQREAVEQAFWAGKGSDLDRKTMLNVEAWVAAFFDATVDNVKAELDENHEEYERPHTDAR